MGRRIAALGFALLILGVCGCSTMEGLGKDIQKLGEKIEDSSK